jgi:thiamine biosynthesis lipoprotein
LLLIVVTGPASVTPHARFEFSEIHMGTRFSIILYSRDARTAKRASGAAFACIGRLDAIMSDYRETSELTKLCRAAHGQWVEVSDDLFRVLSLSQRLAERSGGAFDITIGPVARLWRHARRAGRLPDPERLARARDLVGYDKLRLDEKARSVRLARSGMAIDLGGIAKGYAADRAIGVLERFGIRRALVAAGGDIVVSDPPPGAQGWVVALDRIESSGGPVVSLLLRNRAVSTSGDREQFLDAGGVRYSHIVDPRTGIGVTGQSSVTVVARDCTTSDGLATAASVLGPESGVKLIDATEDAAGIFVRAAGEGAQVTESLIWKTVPKTRSKGNE